MYSEGVTYRLFRELVTRLRHSLGNPKPFHYKLAIVLGVNEDEVRLWEGGQLPDEGMVLKMLRLQHVLDVLGDRVKPKIASIF